MLSAAHVFLGETGSERGPARRREATGMYDDFVEFVPGSTYARQGVIDREHVAKEGAADGRGGAAPPARAFTKARSPRPCPVSRPRSEFS